MNISCQSVSNSQVRNVKIKGFAIQQTNQFKTTSYLP